MIVKLLTERHLEFLSLKGGCRGSSESTLVKMSNCWKSYAAAQLFWSRELAPIHRSRLLIFPPIKYVGFVFLVEFTNYRQINIF